MSQWEMDESAANSVIWAAAQLKVAPNTANRDALFGNTTANAFIDGVTTGMFGVDDAEIAANEGKIAHSGWILRTVGQGGRAGRVQTEVLVAGGITSDAEDTVFPDALITITSQPEDASANTDAAEEAEFTVVATSTPSTTLTYAWTYANGDAIVANTLVGNTTTTTLTINSAAQTVNADYKVTVSATGATSVVSANATLTITTA
jgi:hypothetical protein